MFADIFFHGHSGKATVMYIYIYLIDLLSNQHQNYREDETFQSLCNKKQKKAQKLAIAGKFFAGLRMLVIVGATKTFGFLCMQSEEVPPATFMHKKIDSKYRSYVWILGAFVWEIIPQDRTSICYLHLNHKEIIHM